MIESLAAAKQHKDVTMKIRADHFSRREMLRQGAAAVAATAIGGAVALGGDSCPQTVASERRVVTKGRIRQDAVRWCYEPMPLETLARHAAAIGLKGIEIVEPKDWGLLKRHGLICPMTPSHPFVEGLCHKENHAMCIEKLKAAIDATAQAGFPNVITFSGVRRGMPDDVGLENTVLGLKKVIGYAESKKVNLCLEMINSRVATWMIGQPDYMCDKIEWAVEVCKRISSQRMKILFDVFHVQIMQGDIIARIRQYHQYIGHYHVAGVPGRHEIDDTQEINYPPIMRAIVATGYRGYVGQEFIPTRDPMQSLRQAVKICDV
jgi:hydroxypyruvate isomerase